MSTEPEIEQGSPICHLCYVMENQSRLAVFEMSVTHVGETRKSTLCKMHGNQLRVVAKSTKARAISFRHL